MISLLDTLVLDLRQIAPAQRHATIFGAFQQLPDGAALELHNDHDPLPLRQQFQERWSGRFDWEALESGPQLWRVRIVRRTGGCCGGCCGS